MQKPFRIIICFLSVFSFFSMVRPGSLSKIITVIIPVPRTGTRLRGEFLYPVPLLLSCLILFSEKYKNSLSQQLCRQGDLYILFFFLFSASVFDTEANGHAALGVGADAVTDAVRIDTAKTGGAKG